jgi:hypothetical protein
MVDGEKSINEPPIAQQKSTKTQSIPNNQVVYVLPPLTTALSSSKTASNSSNKKQHSHRRLTNESRVTLMVIIISSNSLFGDVPNSISSLLFTLNVLGPINYNRYLIFGNFLLFLSHSVHFFIYLYFNRKFKSKFFSLFKCLAKN